jgi:hypothetical protein
MHIVELRNGVSSAVLSRMHERDPAENRKSLCLNSVTPQPSQIQGDGLSGESHFGGGGSQSRAIGSPSMNAL